VKLTEPLVVVRFKSVGRFWKRTPDGEPGRHTLEGVARRLGIVRNGTAHRASSDALLALAVLHRITKKNGAEPLPEDAHEAAALIDEYRAEFETEFAAWKAANPLPERTNR